MAVITGLTADRMQEIIDATIVSSTIDGAGHLILTLHDGTTVDAGNAKGADGIPGADGLPGITWKGTWASGTAYAVNDGVFYNGSSYRRLVAGTTATAPDLDATNWTLIALKGSGGGDPLSNPAVKAVKTAVQNIAYQTFAAVNFDALDSFDTDSLHDPVSNASRIYIKTPGIYDVSAQVDWASNATGQRFIAIYKNGVATGQSLQDDAAGSYVGFSLSAHIQCNAGDYLEVVVWHNVSGGLNVTDGMFSAVLESIGITTSPFVSASHSAAVTLVNNVDTAMPFDTEQADNDLTHDPTSSNQNFVCRTSGIYALRAASFVTGQTNGPGERQLNILRNGAIIATANVPGNYTNTDWPRLQAFTIAELVVGDIITVTVRQDSGANLSTVANNTQFQMAKINSPQNSGLRSAPYADVYRAGAAFAIPSGIATDIPFDGEFSDNDGIHDNTTNNSRLYARTAGVYAVTGGAEYAADSAGSYRRIWIQRYDASNISMAGEPVGVSQSPPIPGATSTYLECSTLVELAVGESVALRTSHDAGHSVNVQPGSYTKLSMIKVGPQSGGQAGPATSFTDLFTDSSSLLNYDHGSSGTPISIVSGKLALGPGWADAQLIRGIADSHDVCFDAKLITPSSVDNDFIFRAMLMYDASNGNGLWAQWQRAGGTNSIRLVKFVRGAETDLGGTAIILNPSATYYMRAVVIGTQAIIGHYTNDPDITSPNNTFSANLTSADEMLTLGGCRGRVGFSGYDYDGEFRIDEINVKVLS